MVDILCLIDSSHVRSDYALVSQINKLGCIYLLQIHVLHMICPDDLCIHGLTHRMRKQRTQDVCMYPSG